VRFWDSLYRNSYMRKPILHHVQDYFFPHPRNNHRPHLFSAASVATLALLIVLFEGAYLVQTKIVFPQSDFLASVLPGALIVLTNQDRLVHGLPEVVEDPLLGVAAQAAAEDMAARGYFSHVSPDGKTPWYWLEQTGYAYRYAGQNLAVHFTDSADVEAAWLNSPAHRANIMKSEYTQIGFGVANGEYEGSDTTFVVEYFAAPADERVVPVAPAETAPAAPAPESSAPAQVLGSETAAAPAAAPALEQPSWLARQLTAPWSVLQTVLTALFFIIAFSFTVALFMRGKVQHPSVVFGGACLLLLIPGVLLLGSLVVDPVTLPADGQAASVFLALP